MEQKNRKEELRRKLEELLNTYNEEQIPLSRDEVKGLRESVGGVSLIPLYEKSKYRRSWLGSVYGFLGLAEMYGLEPDFFDKELEELKKLLPFFDATHEQLEKDAAGPQKLREQNEFDVTPEIVEKTNQMLKEAIEKLSY